MKVIVNPTYQALSGYIDRLPENFDEGELIYAARNTLRRFCWEGTIVIVKKYKIPIWINRIAYSIVRKSKAQRGYEYAQRLAEQGIRTPQSVAYIERRSCGLLADSFLVTLFDPAPHLMWEFQNDDALTAEGKRVLKVFAAYTVHLHESGILHEDFTPGNVAFQISGENIEFTLFDINRMQFGTISRKKCLRNFRRLTPSVAVLTYIVEEYARLRKWNIGQSVQTALQAQKRFYSRRK